MRPWSPELAGRLEQCLVDSSALAGNALGDPSVRPLWVYLPPGYDEEGAGAKRYPVVYVLHGYGSTVSRWTGRSPFAPSYPEAADELFSSGSAPPAILAFVDGWTRLGGSQYLDSAATGAYQRYVCEDVVGLVDSRYRTVAAATGRALQGHSSGGYGAVVMALRRPDLFSALAAHAPDSCFEYSLLPDLPAAYRCLRDRYHGSYEEFFADLSSRQALSRPDDFVLLMVYAMAACYSPGPGGEVELPFDSSSGALRDDVWSRWIALDPLRLARTHAGSLPSLAAWLDAGRSDEHRLDVGTSLLADELRRGGVGELEMQLFEGRHSGVEHRYPLALAWLAERLERAGGRER